MHSRCSALPFFVFDFARPTDAKPPDALPYERCPQGVRRCYALAVSPTTAGPSSCRSCMPCECHARLHGSSSPNWSLRSRLARPSRLSQHGSPLAITLGLSRCSCSSSDSTKLLLWLLNPVLRHSSNTSSVN